MLPWIYRQRSELAHFHFWDLSRLVAITVLDRGGAFVEKSFNVLGIGVQEWIRDVHDWVGYLQVLHPNGRSDDSLNIELFDLLCIGGRIKITNQQCSITITCWLHYCTTLVSDFVIRVVIEHLCRGRSMRWGWLLLCI